MRDVILRDGSALRLRSPTLADEPEIRAFFDGLDSESRYLRFHGFSRVDAVARAYAEADGDVRVALVALHAPGVVAVAGYDRLRDPVAAEVAFAVSGPFHGRGLGMRMLEQLAEHAASQGLERFEAEVLAANHQMLGVFRAAGFDVRHEGSGGEVTLVLDIRPTKQLADSIARFDHVASVASLRALLAPRSVAVVGASADPASVGGQIVRKIVDGRFTGVVWPVNRSGGVVCSMRAARTLAELPASPELVVVNAAPDGCLHATMGDAGPPLGGVAISSQSGALGLALLGLAETRGVGVASFVALGNPADVSPNDLLEYWEEDDGVTAIMLYVESFGDPWRFAQIAQRVSRRKPILAVKGRLARVVRAQAGSHTGELLEGDAVFDALFRHCAVLRLDRADELVDLADVLERQPLPQGRNVGVVTNSGGLGTLAADASLSRGLSVPPLSASTRVHLAAALPSGTGLANPVDLTVYGEQSEFVTAVAALLGDVAIDAVVALYIPVAGGDAEGVYAAVEQAAAGARKPTVAAILNADGQPLGRSGTERVPNLRLPEACVAALAQAATGASGWRALLGNLPGSTGSTPTGGAPWSPRRWHVRVRAGSIFGPPVRCWRPTRSRRHPPTSAPIQIARSPPPRP